MKSYTIYFDYLHDIKWFNVEVETESRKENFIMSIYMDGFSLDIPDLERTHKLLSNAIEKQAALEASNFWDNYKEPKEKLDKLPDLTGAFNKLIDKITDEYKAKYL